MRTYLDCIPCFFKQALEAARLAGANKKTQKKILNKLTKEIPKFSLDSSPPEMGRVIYGLVRKITRTKDPYREIKSKSNRLVLKIYPRLKDKVKYSKDRLLKAVELAIAGNIIDYGVKNSLDVNKEIRKILSEEEKTIKKEKKNLFNYKDFRRTLHKAATVLYLGDNAGEVVFDRILIEEIKKVDKNKRIIYAVKEKPIINDALIEDARLCGIDKLAELVSNGLDIPGTDLSLCANNFLEIYKKSDMIISKGQGNFESLSDSKKDIFFLFMAKCPVVAKHVGCDVGDIILLRNKNKTKNKKGNKYA